MTRPGRPNVLLLTIDALRLDHVGCYGDGSQTTPPSQPASLQVERMICGYLDMGAAHSAAAFMQLACQTVVRWNGTKLPSVHFLPVARTPLEQTAWPVWPELDSVEGIPGGLQSWIHVIPLNRGGGRGIPPETSGRAGGRAGSRLDREN